MNRVVSTIAETVRLEVATETLAEYIGYLSGEIDAEQDKLEPNADRIDALEQELDGVIDERRALAPDNAMLINRVVYVYAPFLKQMHR